MEFPLRACEDDEVRSCSVFGGQTVLLKCITPLFSSGLCSHQKSNLSLWPIKRLINYSHAAGLLHSLFFFYFKKNDQDMKEVDRCHIDGVDHLPPSITSGVLCYLSTCRGTCLPPGNCCQATRQRMTRH